MATARRESENVGPRRDGRRGRSDDGAGMICPRCLRDAGLRIGGRERKRERGVGSGRGDASGGSNT